MKSFDRYEWLPVPSSVPGSRDTDEAGLDRCYHGNVWRGRGSHHREECSLMPQGQAEALGLKGPAEQWTVQSHTEARPREAQLLSPDFRSFFSVVGYLRLLGVGAGDCVLMMS